MIIQSLEKMIQMNLFQNRNRLTDIENRLMVTKRKRRGREKGQHLCYKMIANGKGSTWHSKISHQINTAQMGSPKPKGLCLLQFRNEKG